MPRQGTRGSSLSVGRNDPPFETLQLEPSSSSSVARAGHALDGQLVTKDDSGGAGPWLSVTPISANTDAITPKATHATRYGRDARFFFDERAYPERDGFWTRANSSATVVVIPTTRCELSGPADLDHGGHCADDGRPVDGRVARIVRAECGADAGIDLAEIRDRRMAAVDKIRPRFPAIGTRSGQPRRAAARRVDRDSLTCLRLTLVLAELDERRSGSRAIEPTARRTRGRAQALQRSLDAARSRDSVRSPAFRATAGAVRRDAVPAINSTWTIYAGRRRRQPDGWGTRIFGMIWPVLAPIFEQANRVQRRRRRTPESQCAPAIARPTSRSRRRCRRSGTPSMRWCDLNRCSCSSCRRHASGRRALSRNRRRDHAAASGDRRRSADGDGRQARS